MVQQIQGRFVSLFKFSWILLPNSVRESTLKNGIVDVSYFLARIKQLPQVFATIIHLSFVSSPDSVPSSNIICRVSYLVDRSFALSLRSTGTAHSLKYVRFFEFITSVKNNTETIHFEFEI